MSSSRHPLAIRVGVSHWWQSLRGNCLKNSSKLDSYSLIFSYILKAILYKKFNVFFISLNLLSNYKFLYLQTCYLQMCSKYKRNKLSRFFYLWKRIFRWQRVFSKNVYNESIKKIMSFGSLFSWIWKLPVVKRLAYFLPVQKIVLKKNLEEEFNDANRLFFQSILVTRKTKIILINYFFEIMDRMFNFIDTFLYRVVWKNYLRLTKFNYDVWMSVKKSWKRKHSKKKKLLGFRKWILKLQNEIFFNSLTRVVYSANITGKNLNWYNNWFGYLGFTKKIIKQWEVFFKIFEEIYSNVTAIFFKFSYVNTLYGYYQNFKKRKKFYYRCRSITLKKKMILSFFPTWAVFLRKCFFGQLVKPWVGVKRFNVGKYKNYGSFLMYNNLGSFYFDYFWQYKKMKWKLYSFYLPRAKNYRIGNKTIVRRRRLLGLRTILY